MITDVERSSIEGFLRSLQTRAPGRVIAANMLASLREALVSNDMLRDILLDCAETAAASAGSEPVFVVQDVCAGFGIRANRRLRLARQVIAAAGSTLSTTMRTDDFVNFIVDTPYKAGTTGVPVALPLEPADSDDASIQEYRELLAEVTTLPDWAGPGSTLGRPVVSANCWITTDEFGEEPGPPDYGLDTGTKSRDALGLVDCVEGAYLLRVAFSDASLAALTTYEIARPTFADLGNTRFRVSQSSPRAARYAAAGWGATVHLGKFGDSTYSNVTGASERVTSALRVRELSAVVSFLGRVTSTRGNGTNDNHEAFAAEIEGSETREQIREAILEACG